MTNRKAYLGARIFDGEMWHDESVLVVTGGKVETITELSTLSEGIEIVTLDGGILLPGFIDLQVNGGGGVMLNDEPTVEGISRICAAHARFGTTALLPTLITDTPEITRATIKAGRQAKQQGIAGFLGLHLEGPHLSVARKGAHDPSLIRPMEEADLDLLLSSVKDLDVLLTTVAPENVTEAQVGQLANAGIIVSLGHTESSFETAGRYERAGARMVTHLFNAMSPLGHREPGLVGAALESTALHCGLIVDGIHVVPPSMAVALRAKQGQGRIFIVTDAMSPIGTDVTSFTLNGREILRKDGRLTLADGTLAGADIDMLSSVRFVHEKLGLPLEQAVRMASVYPAEAVGISHKGALRAGMDADFVVLNNDLSMSATFIGGTCVHRQ
ncbi:N-acetylglucosamine-6-phosphate deacetylase [Rhizobiales bacterium RZME27]|uniref:N-acetylglucosamine-6-phosphate deacetylase n=1 Tax=Endobacterium cereale TaxID=2663029 RepID=A0A6A8A2R7_9HYPH|nr:N-acetylglucosamine-6-phosphate deacetylase [Endobacterium cereale]MEB2845067.1 N-acetylglucosamine-6-phosphate deacetylase [Endobacterium cereale]MQY44979.1 N-acetylglucosamine-6-phosphate deacetylase [Endobacterium cereale]